MSGVRRTTISWPKVVTSVVLLVGPVVFMSGLSIGDGAVLVNRVLLVVRGWCVCGPGSRCRSGYHSVICS